jgi:hypothetical protein
MYAYWRHTHIHLGEVQEYRKAKNLSLKNLAMLVNYIKK